MQSVIPIIAYFSRKATNNHSHSNRNGKPGGHPACGLTNLVVDPHFSRASSLIGETHFFRCKIIFKKKLESPLILFYFKMENKTRKKTPKEVTS